ncbi:MAG: helix-turn-helix domain-containing protein [Lautropia sp.]
MHARTVIGHRTLDTHRYIAAPEVGGGEFLTCEKIADRRHIHQWQVRPHHHDGALQLFLFHSGSLRIELDGARHAVDSPAFLLVPPLVVHGFDFDVDVDGWVVAVAMSRLGPLLAEDPELKALLLAPSLHAGDTPLLAALGERFALLAGTAKTQRRHRDLALRSVFGAIVSTLADASPAARPARDTAAPGGSSVALLERFRAAVDAHCREHRSIAEHARALGVTPAHLSRTCRGLTGRSALAIVHERLFIEARRELSYSPHTIETISQRLGFAAPSYFARFFGRIAGCTPSAFRRRALARDAHGGAR